MPIHCLTAGFAPFSSLQRNPSSDIAFSLQDHNPEIIKAFQLPVHEHAAPETLTTALKHCHPDLCLLLGCNARHLTAIETSARRPSHRHCDKAILNASWPIHEIDQCLLAHGLPFLHSCDAGHWVCECTYWHLLAFQRSHGYPKHAILIHVPLPALVPAATATERTLASALADVIQRRLTHLH